MSSSPEVPLSFEEVLAQERQSIRPVRDTGSEVDSFSALCISGGGIRSATFAAGVIQGLAEKGLLESFDYLSTVSGGGYIGSWLTAWKHRRGGLDKIAPALAPSAAAPPHNHPDPIQHLREYNSYLSPKLGIFSADSWTLAATVIRNMLLNWLVLVPLLMFVLMVPRVVLSLARAGEHFKQDNSWVWIYRSEIEYLLGLAAGGAFAWAAASALRYLPSVGNKNHTEVHFVRYCLFPLIIAVLAFITLESWFTGGDEKGPTSLTFLGLLAAIEGAQLVGWAAYLALFRKGRAQRLRSGIALTLALLPTGLATASGVWQLVSNVFPSMEWATYVSFAPPLLLLAFSLPIVVFVGLTSHIFKDEDREWLSRAGAWLLLLIVFWAAACSLVLWVPIWAFNLDTWGRAIFASAGAIGGIITALGGFSRKSKVQINGSTQQLQIGIAERLSKIFRVALQGAAFVFVVVFLTGLTMLTNYLLVAFRLVPGDPTDHWQLLEDTRTRWAILASFGFIGVGWFMARFIDVNKFSLHAMYRSRLIRAYMGASNDHDGVNQFIGFATNDDLRMSELLPELRPFHVINVTLNLVSGRRLAWQQRKAESFTISPLHCGSYELGYRPSQEYAQGISLGTAMTLSGAAASPNMGYYSSPIIAFIMTLFNARLGAWLGNPGRYGEKTWRKEGPKSAIKSIVREAFGLTTEEGPYIYLSDGGHFENLGIYEMIRRRCRLLLVVDASADRDSNFESLGNALRKVRIDTKIDIQFEENWTEEIRSKAKRFAIARICYKAVGICEDGILLYIKPIVRHTEPPDVSAYSASHPDFPHEATANQFFNESQTESYRMLGLHTVRELFADENSEPFQRLREHASAAQRRMARGMTAAAAQSAN